MLGLITNGRDYPGRVSQGALITDQQRPDSTQNVRPTADRYPSAAPKPKITMPAARTAPPVSIKPASTPSSFPAPTLSIGANAAAASDTLAPRDKLIADLSDAILEGRKMGMSDTAIKASLLSYGDTEADVMEAFARVGGLIVASTPWYKNWKVLTGIGLGVAALGTGGYFLFRK